MTLATTTTQEKLTFVTTGANMEIGPEVELLVAPLLHTAASEPVLASLKFGGVGLVPFSSLVTVWDALRQGTTGT